MRRVTLDHRAAPLIGRLLRVLTADWTYAAVGGLTLGADPIADAVLHAAAGEVDGPPVDAFVVRKATKQHGMQKLIEGPDVAGRDVLVVEDTSTTGASVLTAVARGSRGGGHGRRCGDRRRPRHGRPGGHRDRRGALPCVTRIGRSGTGLIGRSPRGNVLATGSAHPWFTAVAHTRGSRHGHEGDGRWRTGVGPWRRRMALWVGGCSPC